jgi:putative ABC transport system permease protein
MSKMFYQKLAVENIKKNNQTYFPYILTCICSIMMFYMMHFMSVNEGLDNMSGGSQLKIILGLGTWVIGIFSVIFLFYTNSFLIKRRKKEIGLYNILGMEKRHIAKVLFWENLFVALLGMLMGLLWGIMLSKLMFLVLLKILNYAVPIGFFISVKSILKTIILFAFIFGLTLMNNLTQIHLAKPIELLKGGEVGEKEPKTKWLLTLVGLISLGGGYYIALTTESPLAVLNLFFIAVILVMIGTYALFTAGSITLLKLLKKNKKFYYKSNHFISVSSMIYRMKQNAVGLANISILSTAVLIMVFSTASLYIGMEDVLRTRYPRDIAIDVKVSKEKQTELNQKIKELADSYHVSIRNNIEFNSVSMLAKQDNNTFTDADKDSLTSNNLSVVVFIPLSDYNAIDNQSASLKKDEVLLYTRKGKIEDDHIDVLGEELIIKNRIDHTNAADIGGDQFTNLYYIVVSDEKIADISKDGMDYYYAFDTDDTPKKEVDLTYAINNVIKEMSIDGSCEGIEESRQSFFAVYGGLFFIGIFLGALFIMATVLIIYYKQVSEGYEDKRRFEIMQKVGMSKEEIKKSIKSQVLMVFFVPLITAAIHIAAALKAIIKMLAVLNLTNITLFIYCVIGTILAFALFYTMIYMLTSRTYYKIVS